MDYQEDRYSSNSTMGRATYQWYSALALALIGSCALGGLAVLGSCSYEISLTLQESKLEKKIVREIHLIEDVDCKGYTTNTSKYLLPDSRKYCKIENEAHSGPLESEGAQTFKIMLILCLIAATILGFLQFLGSASVICSCGGIQPLRGKIKAWMFASIIIFLLGCLCLVIPLSFDVSSGKHFNIYGFGSYLKKKFNQLVKVRGVEEIHQHLFYYVVGCNQVLLFVSTLLLSALLPCGTQPYESVYGG